MSTCPFRPELHYLAEGESRDGWIVGDDVLVKQPQPRERTTSPKPAPKRRTRRVA